MERKYPGYYNWSVERLADAIRHDPLQDPEDLEFACLCHAYFMRTPETSAHVCARNLGLHVLVLDKAISRVYRDCIDNEEE